MPRGIDLLVMQAAIAKTGAAWLPVDEDTPSNACSCAWKTPGRPAWSAPGAGAASLTAPRARLDAAEALLPPAPAVHAAPARPVLARCPAYVIYTSGSTGKPKGILIASAHLPFPAQRKQRAGRQRESDRVYQGFSVAFDMSFEEIWIS